MGPGTRSDAPYRRLLVLFVLLVVLVGVAVGVIITVGSDLDDGDDESRAGVRAVAAQQR